MIIPAESFASIEAWGRSPERPQHFYKSPPLAYQIALVAIELPLWTINMSVNHRTNAVLDAFHRLSKNLVQILYSTCVRRIQITTSGRLRYARVVRSGRKRDIDLLVGDL